MLILSHRSFELSLLAETAIQNETNAVTAARQLITGRLKAVLATGISTASGQICDILVSPDLEQIMTADKQPNGVSGSGDVLSAFFLNAILSGNSLAQAAQAANKNTADILAKASTALTMPVLRHIWEDSPPRQS